MRKRTLVGIVLVLTLPPSASAVDPSRKLTQYIHRIWQVQQGLPQASIYSIVQTRDGFLWLGTQTGLLKFDGVHFTTIDEVDGESIANIWVTQLVEDEKGNLWIGTNHNGLITLQQGRLARFSERDGLPSTTVQCLLSDRRGGVWVCTSNGLALLTSGRMRVFGAADGLTSSDIRAACLLPGGALIVGTNDGRIATWDGS